MVEPRTGASLVRYHIIQNQCTLVGDSYVASNCIRRLTPYHILLYVAEVPKNQRRGEED